MKENYGTHKFFKFIAFMERTVSPWFLKFVHDRFVPFRIPSAFLIGTKKQTNEMLQRIEFQTVWLVWDFRLQRERELKWIRLVLSIRWNSENF